MIISLRKATVEDSDDIYCWRNDPVTREQSFVKRRVSYKEHLQWFRKALEDPNKVFYMGVNNKGEKCGVVRFDIINELCAEINVNVAPEKRGKGISSKLILNSSTLFFSETKRKLILARIKEKNIASIKAFQKVGFRELFHYKGEKGEKVFAFILLAFQVKSPDNNF